MSFSVYRIPNLIYGQGRRDVAILESDEEARVQAKEAFGALNDKHRTEMLNKFDAWKRGEHVDKWFHGFNEQNYRECFVFKRKHAGTYLRFYAFLIHPCPLTDARYQVCILVSHAIKNQERTDPRELDFANVMRTDAQVTACVKRAFPEKPGGNNAALHFNRH
jgi:hypothetical protein